MVEYDCKCSSPGEYGTTRNETPATCTSEGWYEEICVECGGLVSSGTIAKIAHQYEWVTITQPSCESTGLKIYRCSVCETQMNQESIPATGHTYGGWTMTVTPDCTNKGSRYKTCKNCGDKVTEDIPALGHDYEWKQTAAPTCGKTGTEVHICSRCSHIDETKTIAATGQHSYEQYEEQAATCTANGWYRYNCSVCNAKGTSTTIPATGHSYGDWITTKEATCATVGSRYHTCSKCDKTETQEISKKSHSYSWVTVTLPSCEESGMKWYTCSGCGNTANTESIPATGHSYGEWTQTKAPSCEESGAREKTCSTCGRTTSESIDAIGHNYKWEITTSPTCATYGTKKYICSNCGDIDGEQVISPTGDHHFEQLVSLSPTCTQQGYTRYDCSICNKEGTPTYIDALGHDWDETQISDAPTCTETGSGSHTCKRCGESEAVTIAKIPHQYEWQTTTQPTCYTTGRYSYKCTACGDEKNWQEIPATGVHDFSIPGDVTLAATCEDTGSQIYKCSTAGCIETTTKTLPATGHNMQKTGETVSPTCTSEGYDVTECVNPNCTVKGKTNECDPIDHDWGDWAESIKAWCNAKGEETCSCNYGCGETQTRIISENPEAHEEVGKVTTEPTLTTPGTRTYTCKRCGVVTRTEEIPAGTVPTYTVKFYYYQYNTSKEILPYEQAINVSSGTGIDTLDWLKSAPEGYEFDESLMPGSFSVENEDVNVYYYYYKLTTITTNHYVNNQDKTPIRLSVNEGNTFRIDTEIDPEQFIKTYTNYTYDYNDGVSSAGELYTVQENGVINYYYNLNSSATYTITCKYYKNTIANDVDLYETKEYNNIPVDTWFDPLTADKIITIDGYKYSGCSETDPFPVTVNKEVHYFYVKKKYYNLTVYHMDIDNEGAQIADAITHNGIEEGTAINPADYQLTDEYLPEGWVYVEGTSIDKLTQNSFITCYYRKTTKSFTIYKKSIYNGKEISESIKKPQGTNIPDTKTLFKNYIKDGIDEYTLDKTKPAAIENLSSNMEVIATYRGYYGYRIKYVYLNTDTNTYVDIQSPEEMVYQSTSQWRFNEDGTAPEIKGFVSTGKVRINEDYEQNIEPLGVITLGSEETIIEYLYTPSSKVIIQFVDYYNTNKPPFKTENVEAKNPFVIPASKENEILDNGYRVNGVKINDNTDVYFGESYTLDLNKLNVITYLCIPAFTNFNDETIKTGETISIKYDLHRNNLIPTYTISQDGVVLSVTKNETDISLLAYKAGTATLTITLGNYTETHTYTVQYRDTPQSIALGVGLTKELSYRESEHTLDYDGELCASISYPDDTYILTGTKKQLLQQTIIVRNKDPKYVITKLYITCTETIYKVTYQYKNEATGQSIKSSRQEPFARGQQVVVNLNSPLYFIEGYQLVAVEKDGEKTNDNIEFTLEADTTITLWYKTTTHTHNFDTKVRTIAPSCVTQGYELWSCSCGETQQKNVKEALGHNWLDWIVTIEPTETAPGQETRTCNRCGTKENRIKNATGVPVEEIDQITLQSKEKDYYPTTTYDMIIVSKTNNKLIDVGAAAPSTLSEGSIYIEGGISVKSNLNSGWLHRTKDGTNRRISPKTTVDLIVLNQNNAQAFIVRSYAPIGTPGPAGTLYFVTGE